jgi:glycosyltransferase involved in cell wall biosynthesis
MGVTAVSQQIIDRIAPTGPHAVVPNGIDPGEWLAEPAAPPAWFRDLPGPRAVYVGTIDSRVDVDGVLALAAQHPELSIVLLGPHPVAEFADRLSAAPNVTVHGPVGRRTVVSVLRNAQIGLLAHRRTPLTEAMSPLKVYEYLAAGLPVLATDLPPVRGLGSRVLLVDEVADFAAVAEVALALGPAEESQRRAFVEANSWASRHEAILDIALRRR